MRLSGFLMRTDGASAVEFAFVGPIFIFLMLAILQGGLFLWTQLGLEHAVESAARYAALSSYLPTTRKSSSDVASYAATQAYGLNIPASAFSYTYSSTGSCGNLVTASYPYYFFSKEFAVRSTTLTAQACFQS